MTYRNDIDALAARHTALETELVEKTRERDASRALLDDARARSRLPVLDNIRIASPCRADWNAMTGDDRVRACGACNKRVYNISEMTRDEAQALLTKHEGNLCARYFQRADGTILLKDCEIGAKQRRRRKLVIAGAALLLGGSGAIAHRLAAMPDHGSPRVDIAMPSVEIAVQTAQTANIEAAPTPQVAPTPEPPETPPVHVTMGAVAVTAVEE